MCLANCIVTKPHLGKVCIFFTNTVITKVGAELLMRCCIIILVVGMIIDYVFMKTLPILKKRAIKIVAPNFRPSYHYSSVVQTASNWNLQKLLKSELKFGYNKASVKSTAFQNCTGKKKHTLANKTTPKPNGT